MSVIIRLQNLPWSANASDIREFFKGLSIPEGGVHIVGGEMGDAFIAFSSDEDARLAMRKTGTALKGIQVSLLLSSRNEMQKVIETARQQAMGLQTYVPPSASPPPAQPAPNQLPATPIIEPPRLPAAEEPFMNASNTQAQNYSYPAPQRVEPHQQQPFQQNNQWQTPPRDLPPTGNVFPAPQRDPQTLYNSGTGSSAYPQRPEDRSASQPTQSRSNEYAPERNPAQFQGNQPLGPNDYRSDRGPVPFNNFRSETGPSSVPSNNFRPETGPSSVPPNNFRPETGPSSVPPNNFRSERGPMPPNDFRSDTGPVPHNDFKSDRGPVPFNNFRGQMPPNDFRSDSRQMPPNDFRSDRGQMPPNDFRSDRGQMPPNDFRSDRGQMPPNDFRSDRGQMPPNDFRSDRGQMPPSDFRSDRGPMPPSDLRSDRQSLPINDFRSDRGPEPLPPTDLKPDLGSMPPNDFRSERGGAGPMSLNDFRIERTTPTHGDFRQERGPGPVQGNQRPLVNDLRQEKGPVSGNQRPFPNDLNAERGPPPNQMEYERNRFSDPHIRGPFPNDTSAGRNIHSDPRGQRPTPDGFVPPNVMPSNDAPKFPPRGDQTSHAPPQSNIFNGQPIATQAKDHQSPSTRSSSTKTDKENEKDSSSSDRKDRNSVSSSDRDRRSSRSKDDRRQRSKSRDRDRRRRYRSRSRSRDRDRNSRRRRSRSRDRYRSDYDRRDRDRERDRRDRDRRTKPEKTEEPKKEDDAPEVVEDTEPKEIPAVLEAPAALKSGGTSDGIPGLGEIPKDLPKEGLSICAPAASETIKTSDAPANQKWNPNNSMNLTRDPLRMQMTQPPPNMGPGNLLLGQQNVPMGMRQPNPYTDQRNPHMGQPNAHMGQRNAPMDQHNPPMMQPNAPMEQRNMRMGQPNAPMGQRNMPMGQRNMRMGQPNPPMKQPNPPMGQRNTHIEQSNIPMGEPKPLIGQRNEPRDNSGTSSPERKKPFLLNNPNNNKQLSELPRQGPDNGLKPGLIRPPNSNSDKPPPLSSIVFPQNKAPLLPLPTPPRDLMMGPNDGKRPLEPIDEGPDMNFGPPKDWERNPHDGLPLSRRLGEPLLPDSTERFPDMNDCDNEFDHRRDDMHHRGFGRGGRGFPPDMHRGGDGPDMLEPPEMFDNMRGRGAFIRGRGGRMAPPERKFKTRCIEVLHVPPEASYKAIKEFFSGLFIARNAIKIIANQDGNRIGVALIEFGSTRDAFEAYKRSGSFFFDSTVTINFIDEGFYHDSFDMNEDRNLTPASMEIDQDPVVQDPCLYVRGLPVGCTEHDVGKVFINFNVSTIVLEFEPGSRLPAGGCFVRFPSVSETETAFKELQDADIDGTPIAILPCTADAMETAIKNSEKIYGNKIKYHHEATPKTNPIEKSSDPNANELLTDSIVIKYVARDVTEMTIRDFLSDEGLIPETVHFTRPDNANKKKAYVMFSKIAEAKKAVGKNGQKIGTVTVTVELVAKPAVAADLGLPFNPLDLFNKSQRENDPNTSSKPQTESSNKSSSHNKPQNRNPAPLSSRLGYPNGHTISSTADPPSNFGTPGCVVALGNVPYNASTEDILNFFIDFQGLGPNNVIRRYDERNRPTSDARVALRNNEDAQMAVDLLNRKFIHTRPIYLSLVD